MKKYLILIILVFNLNSFINAQSLNWAWAKSSGGISNDKGESITTDINGNIYVTGSFKSPSITIGTTVFTNADTSGLNSCFDDLLIVKYDLNGNVIWAHCMGGTQNDYGVGITTDINGNIYVVGSFFSSAITFGNITLTSTGSMNFFIVKYNSSGNVIWAKSSTGSSAGRGICADVHGNIYVIGDFNSATIALDSVVLTSVGSLDLFLAKYDTLGNVIWAKNAGGTDAEIGQSINVNANGNIFVTGQFHSPSVSFGSSTITNTSGNNGYGDFYIAKYDSMGNALWANSAGGGGQYDDSGYGISSDAYGNVYVIGEFCSPTITVGSIVLNNISGTGNNNIFLAKYDSLGNVLWANSLNLSQNRGFGISADTSGNVYVISNFGNTNLSFGSTILTNMGGYDIFIAEYNTSGNVLWATSVGGTSWDYGNSICIDALGQIYITGSFFNSNIIFGSTVLTNSGLSDICVAKLAPVITNIREQNICEKLSVYPNPATRQLTISNITSKTIIRLYDIIGKLIILTEIENTTTFDISSLTNGVYTIVAEDKNGRTFNKVIITK